MNALFVCGRLFEKLQAIEPLLIGGHRVRITRSTEAKLRFAVLPIGATKAAYSVVLHPKNISSEYQIRRAIDSVWTALSDAGLVRKERYRG